MYHSLFLCLLAWTVNGVTITQEQVFFPTDTSGLPLYGQSLDLNDDLLCVGSPGTRAVTAPIPTIASGTVDCYYRDEVTGQFVWFQALKTGGTMDHLSTLDVKIFHHHGDVELYVSAFGTPLGDVGTNFAQNDKTGSVLIWTLDGPLPTGRFIFTQSIDISTPGLEDLSSGLGLTNLGAKLGVHFAITDQWLAIAADGQNVTNTTTGVEYLEAGAVYVLRRNGGHSEWEFAQKITNPEGVTAPFVFFGYNVAFSSDSKFLFISDANILSTSVEEIHKVPVSKVYIYKRQGNGFVFEQTLVSGQPQALADLYHTTDAFGCEMSVDRDWAAISSCFHSNDGRARGATFFVHYEVVPGSGKKWVIKQQVTSDRPADRNTFGVYGTIVKGDTAVIADPARQGTYLYQGGVQVFNLNNFDVWDRVGVVTYSSGQAYDFFGSGLALDIVNDVVRVAVGTGPILDFTPNKNPSAVLRHPKVLRCPKSSPTCLMIPDALKMPDGLKLPDGLTIPDGLKKS